MTYRLILSSQALDDLGSIGHYLLTASNSHQVAESFLEQLIVRCEKLAALPGTLGRSRSELRVDLRSVAFRSYVIFFRYVGDVLEVVTMVEGHRDILAYFRDDEI